MSFRRVSDGPGPDMPAPNLIYPPQYHNGRPTDVSMGPPRMSTSPVPPNLVPLPGSIPSQSSGNSSYSVLSYQTGQSSAPGFMNVFHNGHGVSPQGNGVSSLTDISLEKAMEKVQELASENATLRGEEKTIFRDKNKDNRIILLSRLKFSIVMAFGSASFAQTIWMLLQSK